MKYKLSQICDFITEKIDVENLKNENLIVTYISTENMLPNKNGVVMPTSIPKNGKVTAYKKNDILVSNIRPYFKKIWFAEHNGGCSNDVLVFRAKDNISSGFLYYILADDSFFDYATKTAKGTKMPRGDKKAIMEYEILKTDFITQKKYATILRLLDKKIALNNKINANLEQQAQAIFKSWFVDFEPFGGVMPDDWRIGTISDLGSVVGGGTPSKKVSEYYTDNGISWITPKDLSNNKSKFIAHGEIDITELGLSKSSATLMPEGTVLFSSRAPIGYIAVADGQVSTNQGFKSIIPFESVGTEYIYYFLKVNLSAIENVASGSTFKEVSGSTMKNFIAIIPKNKVLWNFRQICYPIFEQQKILEYEIKRLSKLRDTLLPKLMNGEIDVSQVKI